MRRVMVLCAVILLGACGTESTSQEISADTTNRVGKTTEVKATATTTTVVEQVCDSLVDKDLNLVMGPDLLIPADVNLRVEPHLTASIYPRPAGREEVVLAAPELLEIRGEKWLHWLRPSDEGTKHVFVALTVKTERSITWMLEGTSLAEAPVDDWLMSRTVVKCEQNVPWVYHPTAPDEQTFVMVEVDLD